MAKKQSRSRREAPPRTYSGADIPMRVIREFARRVAERFQPERIILFGSYAYGTPHADSDVDILVIMPAYHQGSKAGRIRRECPAPFPMDLIVRTPDSIRWRLAEGDLFHTEIVTRGWALYESGNDPGPILCTDGDDSAPAWRIHPGASLPSR